MRFMNGASNSCLSALCAALLVLTPALPDKLLADVFPGLLYRSAFDKFLGVVQLFLLGNICIQLLRLIQRIFVAGVRAEVVLAGSFAALVLVGTLLLLLPAASANPTMPITPMDAFFTSVSASCVTGLSVRDTGTAFSNFGQLIILGLIQVGGLGIVTFVAFISVFSAKTLPVPQMVAFRRMISASETDDLKTRLAGILLLTALIEGAGAVSLYSLCNDGRRCAGAAEVERVSFGLRLLQRGIRASVQQSGIAVEQPWPQSHDHCSDRIGRARLPGAARVDCARWRGSAFAARSCCIPNRGASRRISPGGSACSRVFR